MSIIRNVGEQLENSVGGLRVALDAATVSSRHLAEGQSLLMDLAEGSDNPALQEAITSYAHAIELIVQATGHISLTGKRIFTIADRMGYKVEDIPEATTLPVVTIKGILEPTPVGGDRGTTTPEQFRSYEEKEESVNKLLDLGVDPATIDGHVAEGGTCQVYRTPDGNIIKLRVVRVEGENDENEDENGLVPPPVGTAWYGYAEALKTAQGEPALEQYVAYIDDRGVAGRGAVICEPAPGVTVDKMYAHDFNTISSEKLDVLMQGFQALERHELLTDSELSNFMYDPEKGFTIIDFCTRRWHLRENPPTDQMGRGHRMASSFLRSAHDGFGEHDVGARMQEMNEFTNKYVAAYERVFGTEAGETLRETIRTRLREVNEKEDERRRRY